MFTGPLTESLIQKAQEKGLLKIKFTNPRSFTKDKHHAVDGRPFGGGPGMVIKPEPLYDALKSVKAIKKNKVSLGKALKKPYVVYLSPQGRALDTDTAKKLSKHEHLVLICGHYEGIDERVTAWVDEEISIGDYVLTGGELPAMVLIDAVARNLPGVVKEAGSVINDSFFNGLLDYPNYTRPDVFKGKSVPGVLLSGHHKKIDEWRRAQSLKRTLERRPDLLKKQDLSVQDRKLLNLHHRRARGICSIPD
jgi:tRNA (guanine37-N1)-methyltransferase